MAPLAVKDRLLITAMRIEKGWAVDRMTAEFPARQRKWRTLYYFVRRIDSTESVQRLPGSGRRRLVRTDSNIKLVKIFTMEPPSNSQNDHMPCQWESKT